MSIFNLLLNDDEIDKTEFFAVIDEALDLYADYLDLINLDESAERYAKIDAAQNRYMGAYHQAKSAGDAEGAKKHLAMAHKAGNIKVNMSRKGKVKPANPEASRKPWNPRDDRADGSIRDHVEPSGVDIKEGLKTNLAALALAQSVAIGAGAGAYHAHFIQKPKDQAAAAAAAAKAQHNKKTQPTLVAKPSNGQAQLKNSVKESVDQLDELSKETLTRYKEKSAVHKNKHLNDFDFRDSVGLTRAAWKSLKKAAKRQAGIERASERLGEESLSELNHGTLSRYALAALANKRQNSKVADIASKEGDIPGAMDALRKVEKRTAGINKVYDRSKTR